MLKSVTPDVSSVTRFENAREHIQQEFVPVEMPESKSMDNKQIIYKKKANDEGTNIDQRENPIISSITIQTQPKNESTAKNKALT